MNSEKICQVLESFCSNRLSILKDMKKTHLEIDKITESEEKLKFY